MVLLWVALHWRRRQLQGDRAATLRHRRLSSPLPSLLRWSSILAITSLVLRFQLASP